MPAVDLIGEGIMLTTNHQPRSVLAKHSCQRPADRAWGEMLLRTSASILSLQAVNVSRAIGRVHNPAIHDVSRSKVAITG